MQPTDNTCILLTTAPSEAEANQLAQRLVENGLAACVNQIPGVRSTYLWQGELQQESEIQLWVKTRRNKLAAIESWLAQHHPYDVPECLVINPEAGSSAYLHWIKELLDK
jgi:periplasmic divalent cation tolerance protein